MVGLPGRALDCLKYVLPPPVHVYTLYCAPPVVHNDGLGVGLGVGVGVIMYGQSGKSHAGGRLARAVPSGHVLMSLGQVMQLVVHGCGVGVAQVGNRHCALRMTMLPSGHTSASAGHATGTQDV